MNRSKVCLFFLFLFAVNKSWAQNYQAINGSSYAGSLAAGNNPAAIVHVPYAWDLTLFSAQVKQATNAFAIEKFGLLSSRANATITTLPGVKKRFIFANQDVRLLNARISLNTKSAIAFGANLRDFVQVGSSTTNWQDTIYSLADFMKINIGELPLSGDATGATWAELYASYARTIIDDGDHLLNAGLTVKINRALAGGYARARGLGYSPAPAGVPGFELKNGTLQYGYSANIDQVDSNKTTAQNRRDVLQKTYSSLSADIGLEYILLTGEDEEEGGEFAYNTKIGASIMDIGGNKFRYSGRSRFAVAGRPGITDTLIENKFLDVNSIDEFNDSLATIVASSAVLSGDLTIYQPTRLVINVDQHLVHNFFINAELTVPLFPIVSNNSLFIRDMNMLALTPRWELRSMGVYLPMLLNSRKQFWVGGAFKAGPLLMGTHNLANLFSKNKLQNGGLYLAVTLRPGKLYDRQAHYPGRLTRKERRSLSCPTF